MPGDDVLEPRTTPAWLETGVSGVPRPRSWDAVVTVDVPLLRGSSLTRVSFQVLAPGQVDVVGTEGAPTVGNEPLAALATHATNNVTPPLEARAVRASEEQWSIAARTTKRELAEIDLPAGVDTVSVACAPDGELTIHVNGELAIDLDDDLATATASIIERAESKHDAFVATLERLSSGRISLSVIPL